MAEPKSLPTELVSLVHHIELNKAGWWDKAIDQFILFTLWIENSPMTASDVGSKLSTHVGIDLNQNRLERHLEHLRSTGTVLSVSGGKLRLSENEKNRVVGLVAGTEQLEARVKEKFLSIWAGFCPSLDGERAWNETHKLLILPLIDEMGARVYELISAGEGHIEKHAKLATLLQLYPKEAHKIVRTALFAFLNPKDSDVREYILRQLNAHFFCEAGNLRQKDIEGLTYSISVRPSFRAFLDTNFIFCVLGLHENPANEAATLLMAMIAELPKTIQVKLYVTTNTIREIQSWLVHQRDTLKDLEIKPQFADAISTTPGAPPLISRIAQEAKKLGSPIRSSDFLEPYIHGTLEILRQKGVELWNEDTEKLTMDSQVLDDIYMQEQRQSKRPYDKRKSYPQLEHDIVLWHLIARKRPLQYASALSAGYWIVTVDFAMLAFDKFKGSEALDKTPICLHPFTLIQMLQFWIPRTRKFEEAVVGNFRLPLLFQAFDVEAEKVTVRILQALGRYENLDDLPPEVVKDLLVDEALRQRLATEERADVQTALVKETLLSEFREATDALKVAEEARAEQERQLQAERGVRGSIENELLATKAELARVRSRNLRTVFWSLWLLATAGIVYLAIGIADLIPQSVPKVLRLALVEAVAMTLVIFGISLTANLNVIVSESPGFKRFQRARTFLYEIIGGGLIVAGIWEFIKHSLRIH